jgi:hypothetical protein
MKLLPRIIPEDEVDHDITQRDQFNSDEFQIAQTLVREPHQNSLDGRSDPNGAPVRTRIQLVSPSQDNSKYWSELLEPLRSHLVASGLDIQGIDFGMPRILLIEDFGTTGLLGATDKKDKLNFSDFWRRFGVSHKGGGAGGRWGLGKLVFSSASAIGTFFGLTIRDTDPKRERLLMGQSVLNNHVIGQTDYAPHIFFAMQGPKGGIQLPVNDPATLDAFCSAAAISRKDEPGLSIAVLCPRDGLEPEHLLPHVIRNYFFPILTGDLIVEIGDQVVNKLSFEELAKSHGDPELADGALIKFIRGVDADRGHVPKVNLTLEWSKAGTAIEIAPDALASMRKRYKEGGLISVRAPLELRRIDGSNEATFVDAFLQKTPESTKGQALYVRGSITTPGEAKSFRGKKSFAALLASDRAITEFLGDAENPAHTRWLGTADKLSKKWIGADKKVASIRRLLNGLFDLLSEVDTAIDESALVDFFSIPRVATTTAAKPKPVPPNPPPPPPPPPPPKPKAYRVTQIAGGFEIRGNPSAIAPLPYKLTVKAAYGIRRGNPFKKFKKLDFDFNLAKELAVTVSKAAWQSTEPNELLVDIAAHDFCLAVKGFDVERDLVLDVSRST